MITKSKLELYIKLDGDVSALQRIYSPAKIEEEKMYQHWGVIDDVGQRLIIRKSGIESESFSRETSRLVEEHFSNKEVHKLLESYFLRLKN